ncbi:MAG: gamma-glutamyltransferase family protein [Candidatus Rokubacteria bacterium]|nr:gamma-glutamyltransferase family protein [Candidatus Rokubacteria bacterium]
MPLQPMITGARHMISAGHYLATQAGHAILEAGGNAVDAAVAAGIALGVVHSDQVQFSGVAPMLIYLAERDEAVVIAGLGGWPRAARLEAFLGPDAGAIPAGLLRTVVPAAPDAWLLALERFGTMSFGDVAWAAIRHAREGFTMHPVMAFYIENNAEGYRRWPENAAIYLPGGRPPREGELFVQADLARSLQFMADEERGAARGGGRAAGLRAARDAFYRGDLAAAMVRYHQDHGGWLTAEDLAGYRSEVEAPVRTTFRGIDVLACPPWCQGPVLLQMLSLLAADDLRALGHNTTAYVHLVAEVMKLCFADRERYYGDPRFVTVPIGELLSPGYATGRRRLVDPARAWPEMPPAGEVGLPPAPRRGEHAPVTAGRPGLEGDTSYVCVIDRHGNAVSATPSDASWESPVIPGLGFCPSSRGSQSWAVPGHPSSVAPGKRPRLTPNPALAIERGKLLMPFGAPGGDLQPQGMLQVFLNFTVFGMNLQEAVEAPRFVTHSFPGSFEPHPYHPGRLDLERGIGSETGEALAGLGHRVQWLPDLSLGTAGVCAVAADRAAGILYGGADPRRAARAMGW